MKTIWKFQPALDDRIEIKAPRGAQMLSVQNQQGHALTFWALVDTDEPMVTYRFAVYGTGHPIDIPVEELAHVGTVQELSGQLIWHVFEIISEPATAKDWVPLRLPRDENGKFLRSE